MFGTRIKVSLATVGVVAAGLAAATAPMGASAAGVSAAVFQANTTSIVPPVPAGGPGCSVTTGGAFGVQGTCTGTYSFAAGPATGNGGVCVGASSSLAAGNCNITSNNGHYTNIQCGTGTASDSTATVVDSAGVTHATPYNIVFVAGVGVIVGQDDHTAGVVQITPTNGGNCVTTPVATFTATGVAVTTN
jgi:hypothetical protein